MHVYVTRKFRARGWWLGGLGRSSSHSSADISGKERGVITCPQHKRFKEVLPQLWGLHGRHTDVGFELLERKESECTD